MPLSYLMMKDFIEKNSKIEIPLTIKNLLNSSTIYSGVIHDWENKQFNESWITTSNFDSAITQKFNESFDQTKDYDQDGLYFDKDSVLKNSNDSKINFKKTIKFKNNNPIRYYRVDNFGGIRTGQVTPADLKDIVAYQCPSQLETYLYDSTGKKKFIENSGMDDGFIIFDVGE